MFLESFYIFLYLIFETFVVVVRWVREASKTILEGPPQKTMNHCLLECTCMIKMKGDPPSLGVYV